MQASRLCVASSATATFTSLNGDLSPQLLPLWVSSCLLPPRSPLLYSCDFLSLIILFNDNHTVCSLLNFIFDLLAERSWVGI